MADQKRYSLSLSRWHTVAERLNTRAESRAREALQVLGHTQVAFALESEQIAELKKRGSEAVEKIALARQAFGAVAAIRSELARANAELGVSQLLAQQAGIRREQKLMREVGDIDQTLRVSLEKVNDRLAAQTTTTDRSMLLGRNSGVPVALVSDSSVAEARSAAAALEQRLAVVSDEINDLNKNTVVIELPIALAREAGLEK